MSSPPKSLVKSRENLQAIFNNPHLMIKYEMFDKVLLLLWENIRPSLMKPLKSLKHIINLHNLNIGFHQEIIFTEAIILELIEILKKEYPGVDFTYKETTRYDGTIIERVIVMDWS
jgi:hypothetical protein